jgi:hypothetical protein
MLCKRMAAAVRFLTDGDRSMKKGLGLACMPGFVQQASEATHPPRQIRMLGPSTFSRIASARS